MEREKYDRYKTLLHQGIDSLVLRGRSGKERILPPDKWYINRNTPVGEDADIWERKPWGGKKWINSEIIAVIHP